MVKLNDDMKKLIKKNALAFATVDDNGNPHCIAVGFAKVVSNKQVLITDNFLVETTKNIKINPNVALTVWSRNWEDDCKGFELKGIAEYFKDGRWYEEIKKIPENEKMPCKGAILVTVNKIKRLA
ncbi:MAG: pyridoxamine 5'-phosphate oxidase family protein [Nanoarchaeota archaeon]|nr:pyridoxamine 5'-phosphate oxidase family protein [Nanoarchaeota archaeon]